MSVLRDIATSGRILLAGLLAGASRSTTAIVDLKDSTPSTEEVTTSYGEIATSAPVWTKQKERADCRIKQLPDVDLGYSIETAPWSDADLTGDKRVDRILRNADYITKMRILEYIESHKDKA